MQEDKAHRHSNDRTPPNQTP